MSEVQTPAPPVERTIHGKLTGVEMRNAGWHRFSILEPGNQYPYRADTKKKELIDQAMSLMNQDVTVQAQERPSENINEHTGQPYVNKYLNSIAHQSGAQQQPEEQQWPPTGPQPVQEKNIVQPQISGFDKDMNIMRQTASKVVGMMWAHLPAEQRNPEGMVKAMETLIAYYIHGPKRFGIDGDMPLTDHVAAQAMQDRSELDHDDRPPEIDPNAEPCPDCGFKGAHALGCPRADFL